MEEISYATAVLNILTSIGVTIIAGGTAGLVWIFLSYRRRKRHGGR